MYKNLQSELEAANGAKADAKREFDKASFALAKARNAVTAANAKVSELEAACETSQNEQAQRLHASICADGPTSVLPDIAAEALVTALASAKLHATITAKAFDSIEATHKQAEAVLSRADSKVRQVEAAIVEAQKPVRAARFEKLVAELTPLAQEIWAYTPKGADRRSDYTGGLSPFALHILDSFFRQDQLYTPLNRLERVSDEAA